VWAFSPDGKADGRWQAWTALARLWDTESGKELRVLQGHSDRVHSLAFSPDGKRILSGSADKTARLLGGRVGQGNSGVFQGHALAASLLSRSARTGKQVLTASRDRKRLPMGCRIRQETPYCGASAR